MEIRQTIKGGSLAFNIHSGRSRQRSPDLTAREKAVVPASDACTFALSILPACHGWVRRHLARMTRVCHSLALSKRPYRKQVLPFMPGAVTRTGLAIPPGIGGVQTAERNVMDAVTNNF